MIEIVSYCRNHQPRFEKLNREWIEKFFRMEKVDEEVLQQPEEFILRDGGFILMALWEGEAAGTVALRKMKTGDFELTKMAVDEKFRGRGIGEELIKKLLERAAQMGLEKVILYSNTVLKPAIRLYRRMGFIEMEAEKGVYARCNIKMEFRLRAGQAI
jgi:ribosomal protein S18 acetylase RimI-like enzyme